jgi:hypothetical protein
MRAYIHSTTFCGAGQKQFEPAPESLVHGYYARKRVHDQLVLSLPLIALEVRDPVNETI